jgi:hypothetical protein
MVMGATAGMLGRDRPILMSVICGLFGVPHLWRLDLMCRRFVVIGIDLSLRVGVASAH